MIHTSRLITNSCNGSCSASRCTQTHIPRPNDSAWPRVLSAARQDLSSTVHESRPLLQQQHCLFSSVSKHPYPNKSRSSLQQQHCLFSSVSKHPYPNKSRPSLQQQHTLFDHQAVKLSKQRKCTYSVNFVPSKSAAKSALVNSKQKVWNSPTYFKEMTKRCIM